MKSSSLKLFLMLAAAAMLPPAWGQTYDINTLAGKVASVNGTAGLQSVGGGSITAFNNVFTGNALMFNMNGGQIFTGGDNASAASDPVGATTGGASRH